MTDSSEPPPDLWTAASWLVAGSPEEKAAGLRRLTAGGTPTYSPLVLHLLASCLSEKDLRLRRMLVGALAEVLETSDGLDKLAPGLRSHLQGLLGQFGQQQVRWIVEAQAAAGDGQAGARLLSYVPAAGTRLMRLAANAEDAPALRAEAIRLIGEAGFVDSIPALEGLEARLSGGRAGQLSMSFAPREDPAADQLLPAVQGALEALREVD